MRDNISDNEWARKSKEGELCGLFGCENDPENKCSECNKHYCSVHKHLHEIIHDGF